MKLNAGVHRGLIILVAAMTIAVNGCMIGDILTGNGDGGEFDIQWLDVYAGDGEAMLYWHSNPPPADHVMDEPRPHVDRIEICRSTSGKDSGCQVIHHKSANGLDSLEVEGLQNGQPYYFLLRAYSESDRLVGMSHPRMITTSSPRTELLRSDLMQSGMFYAGTNLAWSPDGERILMVRKDTDLRENIYALDISRETLEPLTDYESPHIGLSDISWSPDGTRVAYMHSPTIIAGLVDYKVWIMNVLSREQHSVTSGRVDFDPVWLDTDRILFCKGTIGPPNIPELVIVEVNSGVEQTITFDGAIRKYCPTYSAGNRLIVYEAQPHQAANYDLYITSVDGGMGEPLVNNKNWWAHRPCFSPEGRLVYFTSDRSGHYEIWVLNLDTDHVRQITTGLTRGVERDFATINPTGNYIAFIEENASHKQLLRILEL